MFLEAEPLRTAQRSRAKGMGILCGPFMDLPLQGLFLIHWPGCVRYNGLGGAASGLAIKA